MEDLGKRTRTVLKSLRPDTAAPTRATPETATAFIAVAAAGLVSGLLPPYVDARPLEITLVAFGFAACLALVVVAIRRPERTWVDPLPAFLFFGVFAVARDASGEAHSGLAPLIVLPILWLALTGGRRDLWIGAGLTAAVFLGPLILIGPPAYPMAEWRQGVLWTAVALLVAPVIQRIVAEVARQRQVAEEVSAANQAILRGAHRAKIISYDFDGIITSFSVGAQELLGYDPDTLIGKKGPEFLHEPDEVARVAAELGVEPGFEVFRTLAETGAPSRVWVYRTADGGTRHMQLVLTQLLDADERPTGYLGVAVDVTDTVRAERELAASEERWRTLLDHLPDTVVLMLDEQLVIRAVGGQGAATHDLSESAIGRHLAEFSHPENMSILRDLAEEALAGRDAHSELRATADGSDQEVMVTPLPSSAGGALLLVARDVSRERSRAREADRARRRAERLFADAPHGVAVLHPDGTVVRANQSMERLVGASPDQLSGRNLGDYAFAGAEHFEAHLSQVIADTPELVTTDMTLRGPEAAPLQVTLTSRVLPGDVEDGENDLVLIHVVDVSERRRYEDRLAHLADHDPLTGLANRRRFDEELQRHQELCARYGAAGAVLLLDLDRFKEVNDSLGHSEGDQLIISTGALLRQCVRGTDVIARLGGDEFAVLLTEGDRETATQVGAKLVQQVREHTAALDSSRRNVTATIGGVTFADAETSKADILALADMMMYEAKEDGRNRCAVFDASRHVQPRMGARMEWRARVERALENDDFELHLQPLLDLRTDRVASAEALIRLADTDELVLPGHFLHIAERAGLAPALDRWVLEHSIPILKRLRAKVPDFTLEVNLSGHSIGDPTVEATIADQLQFQGVDPAALVLEITETAAVADIEMARVFGERVSSLGCKFALDDFGAGFGSFYYLKHLICNYVKIDGEFVAHCHRSQVDRTILRSIVGIANDMGKQTIAEFVGEEATLEVVREEGVDFAQGFFIGKPMPIEQFIATLDAPGSYPLEVKR